MTSVESFPGKSRSSPTVNTDSDSKASAAPLTVNGILSSVSSAPNPPLAALEQIVAERNVLSSQNSQLWKLVEKQRSGYGQILKELERVRLEREIYKTRLETHGDDPDKILKAMKTQRKSLKSSDSVLQTDEQNSPSDPKSGMTQRQSEDSVPQKTPTSSRSQVHESTSTLTSFVGPRRADSLQPVSTAPIPPSSRTGLLGSAKLTPLNSALTPNSNSVQSFVTASGTSSLPSSSSLGVTPSPARTSSLTPSQKASLNVPQDRPQSKSAQVNTWIPPSLSRESRISIPEETKRYMATIDVPSSRLKEFGPDTALANPGSTSTSFGIHEHGYSNGDNNSRVFRGGDHGGEPGDEFLDLDDDDDDDDDGSSEDEDQDSLGSASSTSDREPELDRSSSGSGSALEYHIPRKSSIEDFPMPPTGQSPSQSMLPNTQPPQVSSTSIHSNHSRALSEGASDLAPSSSSQSHLPYPVRPPAQRNPDGIPQPHFRALPLLATDLPHTKVQVSHSSIRPNDRGKEVLSFVIVVDPGKGKESWNIEKLYSDVIALDQRIKSMSRSLSKRMPGLPDSKLWKDHAPAKVDQRKVALEQYLQALIVLPVKDKNDIIAFFTSDIVRARQPVASAGYKEGYLTKRGKNFGGWKRRYFVLQGSMLEYYESRGGAHLGSINIIGAQIGRQQRSGNMQGGDEDNEYRHAFLIIESKRGPSGTSNRHVLCAESDKDRDSWVEILVKHVTGNYQDDQTTIITTSSMSYSSLALHTTSAGGGGSSLDSGQARSSTSSSAVLEATPKKPVRGMSKDDISRGPAVPISQLAPDSNNAKLFSAPVALVEEAPSTTERTLPSSSAAGADVPLSSSLPISSPLEGDHGTLVPISPRSTSELGHYPDAVDAKSHVRQGSRGPGKRAPEYSRSRDREKRHTSIQPLKLSPSAPKHPPDLRSRSPDPHTPRVDMNGKVKISGPIGGGPLPAGYKFTSTSKDKESMENGTPASNDRREKAKSRMFWNFGRPSADKPAPVNLQASRAVFGVSIEDSLEIAQIANLPAVVFRCIQYLETKNADQEEGIYRLSGSSAVIKALRDRFNNEGDVDLLASDEYWDPHAIAGLLKSFMRELPGSILTRELHTKFLSVIDFVDARERVKELSNLISSLPLGNYSLLRALTAHLILIVQNCGVNKMTMRNVGIVFSPTLGIPAGVFSLMLGEFNRVFNIDDSEAAEDADQPRNSRHYTDAAADELLGLSGRSLPVSTDDQSDDGGDDLSINDDSETENTDDPAPTTSSAGTSGNKEMAQSRISAVAANRGIGNLNVTGNRLSDTEKRTSRVGLPASPRPQHSPWLPTSPHSTTP